MVHPFAVVSRLTTIVDALSRQNNDRQQLLEHVALLPLAGFEIGMGIGADGLKTGETSEAGFNLVGSALQDNLRLIAVVTGTKSEKERADEAKKLLEFGFHDFP